MEDTKKVTAEFTLATQGIPEQLQQADQKDFNIKILLKKLRGGFFLVIGYLLSPLSFWNDLFFNLPIAYLFGYVCSLISPNLLISCSILGYWLSNIAGILLMQVGAMDVFQEQPQRNIKKELLMGLLSSVVYTIVILALVQLKILQTPDLFSGI